MDSHLSLDCCRRCGCCGRGGCHSDSLTRMKWHRVRRRRSATGDSDCRRRLDRRRLDHGHHQHSLWEYDSLSFAADAAVDVECGPSVWYNTGMCHHHHYRYRYHHRYSYRRPPPLHWTIMMTLTRPRHHLSFGWPSMRLVGCVREASSWAAWGVVSSHGVAPLVPHVWRVPPIVGPTWPSHEPFYPWGPFSSFCRWRISPWWLFCCCGELLGKLAFCCFLLWWLFFCFVQWSSLALRATCNLSVFKLFI